MGRVSGCLGCLARALALLLSVLLAVSLPLGLSAHNLGRLVFSPQRMTELIVSRVAENSQLRRQLVAQVFNHSGSPEGDGFDFAQATRYLSPAQQDAIADALFPPGWLAEQIQAVLEQLYAWPDSEERTPNLTLDVRPVYAWWRSGGAHDLAEVLVDSWPACSVQQVERIMLEAAGTQEVTLQYCEPPEPYRSVLVGVAAAALLAQTEALPPHVRVGGVATTSADVDQIMAAKEQIRLARAFLLYGWLLPLSLLGLIMALAIRSYRQLALWWGIPLLVGGLLGFLLLLAGEAALGQAIARFAESRPSELPVRLVTGLTSGLVSEVRPRLVWQSVLLTMGGTALVASGVLSGRRRQAPDLGSVPPSAQIL